MAITTAVLNSSAATTGQGSIAVTTTAIGDVLVVTVLIVTGVTCTGVSGGGVTTWNADPTVSNAAGVFSAGVYFFWGIVTATGAQTLTINYGSAIGTNTVGLVVLEASDGGPRVWTRVTSGVSSAPSANATMTYPTLVGNGLGGSQVYVGHAESGSTANSGTTGAFTATAVNGGDASLAGLVNNGQSVTPTSTQTGSSVYSTFGIILQTSNVRAPGMKVLQAVGRAAVR